MNSEHKYDFKNLTKNDVRKLPAPHPNYVKFTYLNAKGIRSERELRVFSIKNGLIYAFDVEKDEIRTFKPENIEGRVLMGDDNTFLSVDQWVRFLSYTLEEINVLPEVEESCSVEQSDIKIIKDVIENIPYLSDLKEIIDFNQVNSINVEYIGFDETASLLLDHIINQIKIINDDNNISKWVVINNLSKGFIDVKIDKSIRYLTLKEFLTMKEFCKTNANSKIAKVQ